MHLIQATLKKGKDKAILRRHPWVFSGAISSYAISPKEGDWVQVLSYEGEILATGYYSNGSIAIRLLDFCAIENFSEWITKRIQEAYNSRRELGFINETTNCYRLLFAEADLLPGLIVDIYDKTAVLQCHTIGMYQHRDIIATAVVSATSVSAVYDKSADILKKESLKNDYLIGETGSVWVLENGHHFSIDWENGQKTGFFIDQRDNRQFVKGISKGKKVLNAFSYSGGFSVYALAGGATEVHSVDISASAIELCETNVSKNGLEKRHHGIVADGFDYLKNMEADYDIIILDPPAFAKSQRVTHNALVAYKRLNAMAMKKMQPGSKLLTFSCSQHITAPLFADALRAAAIEVGKPMKIVHRFTQPMDHPMNIFHPEGEYLKGLMIEML